MYFAKIMILTAYPLICSIFTAMEAKFRHLDTGPLLFAYGKSRFCHDVAHIW